MVNCSLTTSLHPTAKLLTSSSKPSSISKSNSKSLLFLPDASKTNHQSKKLLSRIDPKPTIDPSCLEKPSLALTIGALLTIVDQPALAITGVNNEEELSWKLIQIGIIAFWYFLIMPPVIFNWLRLRWYKRKFLEMYFQFLFVFMFFPGMMLWAPFINFRPLPNDPTMKYPWSTPQNPQS